MPGHGRAGVDCSAGVAGFSQLRFAVLSYVRSENNKFYFKQKMLCVQCYRSHVRFHVRNFKHEIPRKISREISCVKFLKM